MDEDEEEQWEVDRILSARCVADNGFFIEYQVLWKGWPSTTWEPLENVLDCMSKVDLLSLVNPGVEMYQHLDMALAFYSRPEHACWRLLGRGDAQTVKDSWLECTHNRWNVREGHRDFEELVIGFVESLARIFPDLT